MQVEFGDLTKRGINMRAILALIPALACVGMVFVCGRMLFGHHGADAAQLDEISQLREENARLREERRDPELQHPNP
jgi:hypothetical protein